MTIKREPQECVRSYCDGEICWDEDLKDYVCMKCDASATKENDDDDVEA